MYKIPIITNNIIGDFCEKENYNNFCNYCLYFNNGKL